MEIRFTARHMDGGVDHPHIGKLRWIADGTIETKESTRSELVDWIRNKNGQGYVNDKDGN